jgi:hypothetical protein
MRSGSKSPVKFLRPFFALLLVAALAELTSPTLAQVRTDCLPSFESGDGTLSLRLESTAAPAGGCANVDYSTQLVPGSVVPACYSGPAQSNPSVILTSLTTCTVCSEGQAGCYVYLPPPNPVPTYPIDPSIVLPPIHAFYDPYGPWSPDDPYNPMHPYDPWDPWWPTCLAPYDPRAPWMY